MHVKFEIHPAYDPKARVSAHVTRGTAFVTVAQDDTRATFFLSIEQTRKLVADLTRGLAEHDLIAKAKAEAAAQGEAAEIPEREG